MAASIGNIAVHENVDKHVFLKDISPCRVPAILRGIDIGPCVDKWTVDYLSSVPGSDREVKIHVSETKQLDFIKKNFAYRSLQFGEFVRRASQTKQTQYFFSEDEYYYLRSLGDDPRKDISNIEHQFPALANDINIPHFFDDDKFFSSVFRISSAGLQLWTHYDIMDNLLIQITGRKRVVLYSPRDAVHLYLNGDKSEVLDIDNPDLKKYPDFVKAKRYECVLEPGDILFLPAMWFHNVIYEDFGVAVNVFWKHLDHHFYDNKDTYGNKDLTPAIRAIQILDKAIKTLDELPEEYRDFYARRMVTRIQNKAYSDHLT